VRRPLRTFLALRVPSALLALAVSFSVAACEDPLPPIPPPHPKHDLLIEGGMFRYNGTPLGPGVPSQVWLDRLGPPERVGVSMWFWDSLGLAVGAGMGPPTPAAITTCVTVLFEIQPWMISATDDLPGFEPKGFPVPATKTFPGRILLEGAPLFKKVQPQHINQRMKLECYSSTRGAGFRGPPSFSVHSLETHECKPQEPPRSYFLSTYLEKRKRYATELTVCCQEGKPCR
jgi:hypothetical protein